MSEYKLQTKNADGTMVDIDLSVLDSKTFENVIATGTSQAASNFYYGSVKVADFTTPWNIRILVSAHIPNQPNYSAMYELNYFGVANTSTYYFKIQQRNTSYRPAYLAPLYYATSAGVATYGHLLGIALRSSTNPTNASYKRTFEFKVLEQRNCKFSFFDSMLLYANVPGTGSTNYSGITEPAIAWNGLQESGDSDTYDRLRYTGGIVLAKSAIVAGNLIVSDGTGYSHLKTGTAFDIRYPVLYAGSAISANATGTNNYLSINATVTTTQSLTMTVRKILYMKGKLSGTTFTPVSTAPLTQTEPTSDDGYDYMLIGMSYSATAFCLFPSHPIYHFHDGKLTPIELIKDDSDTTYSLSGSGATVTLTPSSGSAQSITVNNVENATKATKDGDGNVISSTYLKQHQSLANYVTTNTGQDISGTKNFTSLQKFDAAQFVTIHGPEYGDTGTWQQVNMNTGFFSNKSNSGIYWNDNDGWTASLAWDEDGDVTLRSSQSVYINGSSVNIGGSNCNVNLTGTVKVNGANLPSVTLNGSANSTPSFYAPTSVGTNGYYLKSNGSGAPTWAALPSSGGEANVVTSVNGSTTRTGIYAATSPGTNLISILAGKGSNAAPVFVKLYHGTGTSDRAGSTSSSSALTNSNYYMKLDINNDSASSYSLMICYGTFSNTKKTSAVTFSMSFSYVPMVFTSLMHPGDAQSHRCQPTSITKSQFSMAYNTGQQGQYIAIGWVANSF